MLVWTLRMWPKAQYLARAMGIPPDAWEIPYLFAPVGGPELSVFEAMDRPELGGLTQRLKALTKPLAAAAFEDPWVFGELLAGSKLAMAFHPGVDIEQVRTMSERDGYRVVGMAERLAEKRAISADMTDEGLIDGHAELRAAWRNKGMDDDAMVDNTVRLPVWSTRYHSAAFYLTSRTDAWGRIAELCSGQQEPNAATAVAELVRSDIEHRTLLNRLGALHSTGT